MSAWSGRERGLAALSADLVPHGRGLDSAVAGRRDATDAVAHMATEPSAKHREEFFLAVQRARASEDSVYSDAFEHAAWQAIDDLRHAAAIGGA